MTAGQIADAIAAFSRNLDASICMEDRRSSVQLLADKLGSTAANQIADIFGLKDSYYKA